MCAALVLSSSASAAKGSFRVALVEGKTFRSRVSLHVPFEALIKAHASSATVIDARTLPCYYSGNDFRFRIPTGAGLMTLKEGEHAAAALESEGEVAIVVPAIPSLVEGLRQAAADPAKWKSWYEAWNVELSTRAVSVSATTGPEGETLLSALVRPGEEAAAWNSTISAIQQVTWEGRQAWVIFVPRLFGGPGRLTTALAEEEKARGPVIKLARGDVLWSYVPELRGRKGLDELDKLGVTHSAVGTAELRRWGILKEYEAADPDPIKFLSANLVYSTDTTKTLLPAYDIIETGGLRIALVGITHMTAGKFLRPAGLTNLTVVEPGPAVARVMPEVRRKADAVVLFGDIPDDAHIGLGWYRGVDLILAADETYPGWLPPPDRAGEQADRPQFMVPLMIGKAYPATLSVWDASVTPGGRGGQNWTVRETHRRLDDTVAESAGALRFDPSMYGVTISTGAPLLPAAYKVFGEHAGSANRIGARDFWSLAASLTAAETRSEVALLRVGGLVTNTAGDLSDGVVRSWLDSEDTLQIFHIPGADLKSILAETEIQRLRETKDQPYSGVRYAVGGVGPGFTIHGTPIVNRHNYRVAVASVLAEALGFNGKYKPTPVAKPLDELVYDALVKRRGTPPAEVRRWTRGEPLREGGYWTVNFRDVGLNLQNTKVVRDDAFNSVPNSRIQGFDELLIGGTFKTDAEYVRRTFRWNNTVELEYARSRLRPRNAPAVTNTTANRIFAMTSGTRNAGVIRQEWFAKQWGPSLGVQYESQFEAAPGLKRKQIYSVLPGLSFLDGTWIRRFEIAGNIKRDLSRDPPNTQSGLFTKLILSRDIGPGPVRLQGELWSNYFFRTRQDTIQDLLFEGDANLKLRVPIRKHLSIAPFVDFYWFGLKTQRIWGYSAMMGVQIGFSRLWKPQYEPLLGSQ